MSSPEKGVESCDDMYLGIWAAQMGNHWRRTFGHLHSARVKLWWVPWDFTEHVANCLACAKAAPEKKTAVSPFDLVRAHMQYVVSHVACVAATARPAICWELPLAHRLTRLPALRNALICRVAASRSTRVAC